MKITIHRNWTRWARVLNISEKINADLENATLSEAAMCSYLDSLEETLNENPSIANDVKEFALTRLCRSFKKALVHLRGN